MFVKWCTNPATSLTLSRVIRMSALKPRSILSRSPAPGLILHPYCSCDFTSPSENSQKLTRHDHFRHSRKHDPKYSGTLMRQDYRITGPGRPISESSSACVWRRILCVDLTAQLSRKRILFGERRLGGVTTPQGRKLGVLITGR